MATIVQTTNATETIDVYTGDTFILASGTSIEVVDPDLYGLSAYYLNYDIDFIIGGQISGTYGIGLWYSDSGYGVSDGINDSTIAIGDQGRITALTGILAKGSGVIVNNAGNMTATTGIDIDGAGAQIVNSGDIVTSGAIMQLTSYGSGYETSRVVNNGFMSGDGIEIGSSASDYVSNFELINTGSIFGFESALYVNSIQNNLFYIDVENSGLIVGNIDISDAGASGRLTFVNTGQLTGDVISNDTAATLYNNGIISGAIEFGTDNDYIKNGGHITGNVEMSDGNDTFVMARNGTVEGGIYGEDGDDTLELWASATAYQFETIKMRGKADVDFDHGGGTDFTNATIIGNRGNNDITGTSGDNTIRGRRGDDVIDGDLGRDRLYGGRGDDDFVFYAVADSGTGNGNRDRIMDFTRKSDIIDLTDLVDGDIRFLKSGGFTASGRAELQVLERKSFLLVKIDDDGDGITDMEIEVAGAGKLTAGDFLL